MQERAAALMNKLELATPVVTQLRRGREKTELENHPVVSEGPTVPPHHPGTSPAPETLQELSYFWKGAPIPGWRPLL